MGEDIDQSFEWMSFMAIIPFLISFGVGVSVFKRDEKGFLFHIPFMVFSVVYFILAMNTLNIFYFKWWWCLYYVLIHVSGALAVLFWYLSYAMYEVCYLKCFGMGRCIISISKGESESIIVPAKFIDSFLMIIMGLSLYYQLSILFYIMIVLLLTLFFFKKKWKNDTSRRLKEQRFY